MDVTIFIIFVMLLIHVTHIIGASRSEPYTSDVNRDFLYMYIYMYICAVRLSVYISVLNLRISKLFFKKRHAPYRMCMA